MQITTDNLFRAYLKSRTLHENLLTADTLLRYTHGKVPPDSPIIRAKADLRELADAMGFDLVERVTAKDALAFGNNDLAGALRDMAMAFGHPEDEAVQAWWEERADEALEEGRSADWYRNEARARASRALSLAGTAHNKLLNAIGNVGTDGEAPILSAMSKGEYLARQTKTIPVSDLLHDEPGVQVDGSTTMGFR